MKLTDDYVEKRSGVVLDSILGRLDHLANKVVTSFGSNGSYTDDWGVEQTYNSSDKKKGKSFKMATQFCLKIGLIQLKLLNGGITADGAIQELEKLDESISQMFED